MINSKEELLGVHAIPLYRPQACKRILDRVKKLDNWEDAQVRTWEADNGFGSEFLPSARDACILPLSEGEDIYRNFDLKIDRIIKPFVSQQWRTNFSEHSGTQLVRYRTGGHYVAHKDAGLDYADRYFTILCYLNEDFEGGGTRFPSLKYTVSPQCGKAVVFPSNYAHQAEPVSHGEKYVLVAWLVGPAPIRWI